MFSRNPFDLNLMAFKFNSHDRNKPLQSHVTPTFGSSSSKNAQSKPPARNRCFVVPSACLDGDGNKTAATH